MHPGTIFRAKKMKIVHSLNGTSTIDIFILFESLDIIFPTPLELSHLDLSKLSYGHLSVKRS